MGIRSRHLPWAGPEIAQPWKFHSLAVEVSRRIQGFGGAGGTACAAGGLEVEGSGLDPEVAGSVPAAAGLRPGGTAEAAVATCFVLDVPDAAVSTWTVPGATVST